jgi:hypothetical protein
MFIAALFTIDKLWKQPRYPTTDEWIKKMWYLYPMEFYSAMKKNAILSFARLARLRRPKNRMFSLISDFRSWAKAVMLNLGHTLKGEHIMELWGQVGNPKLESRYLKTLMSPLQRS